MRMTIAVRVRRDGQVAVEVRRDAGAAPALGALLAEWREANLRCELKVAQARRGEAPIARTEVDQNAVAQEKESHEQARARRAGAELGARAVVATRARRRSELEPGTVPASGAAGDGNAWATRSSRSSALAELREIEAMLDQPLLSPILARPSPRNRPAGSAGPRVVACSDSDSDGGSAAAFEVLSLLDPEMVALRASRRRRLLSGALTALRGHRAAQLRARAADELAALALCRASQRRWFSQWRVNARTRARCARLATLRAEWVRRGALRALRGWRVLAVAAERGRLAARRREVALLAAALRALAAHAAERRRTHQRVAKGAALWRGARLAAGLGRLRRRARDARLARLRAARAAKALAAARLLRGLRCWRRALPALRRASMARLCADARRRSRLLRRALAALRGRVRDGRAAAARAAAFRARWLRRRALRSWAHALASVRAAVLALRRRHILRRTLRAFRRHIAVLSRRVRRARLLGALRRWRRWQAARFARARAAAALWRQRQLVAGVRALAERARTAMRCRLVAALGARRRLGDALGALKRTVAAARRRRERLAKALRTWALGAALQAAKRQRMLCAARVHTRNLLLRVLGDWRRATFYGAMLREAERRWHLAALARALRRLGAGAVRAARARLQRAQVDAAFRCSRAGLARGVAALAAQAALGRVLRGYRAAVARRRAAHAVARLLAWARARRSARDSREAALVLWRGRRLRAALDATRAHQARSGLLARQLAAALEQRTERVKQVHLHSWAAAARELRLLRLAAAAVLQRTRRRRAAVAVARLGELAARRRASCLAGQHRAAALRRRVLRAWRNAALFVAPLERRVAASAFRARFERWRRTAARRASARRKLACLADAARRELLGAALRSWRSCLLLGQVAGAAAALRQAELVAGCFARWRLVAASDAASRVGAAAATALWSRAAARSAWRRWQAAVAESKVERAADGLWAYRLLARHLMAWREYVARCRLASARHALALAHWRKAHLARAIRAWGRSGRELLLVETPA